MKKIFTNNLLRFSYNFISLIAYLPIKQANRHKTKERQEVMLNQHKLIGREYSVFVYTILILSICFQYMPVAYAKGDLKQALLLQRSLPNSKASLFSKTGSGEFYTLYPDGLEVQDANIGGFKSVQLDPNEENLYFYDSGSKVISRINLKDGKVYKVIGKPKNSKKLDYSEPVKFSDASLVDFTDFTFDKNGDIFILDSNKQPDIDYRPDTRPRILKASLKDGTLKQVVDFEHYFWTVTDYAIAPQFLLDGIASNPEGQLFIYGQFHENQSNYGGRKSLILKFDPLLNKT